MLHAEPDHHSREAPPLPTASVCEISPQVVSTGAFSQAHVHFSFGASSGDLRYLCGRAPQNRSRPGARTPGQKPGMKTGLPGRARPGQASEAPTSSRARSPSRASGSRLGCEPKSHRAGRISQVEKTECSQLQCAVGFAYATRGSEKN